MLMEKVFSTAVSTFCIALGVILGGTFLGALGAFLVNRPPLYSMIEIAERIKIWALFVALGDIFTVVRNIERGFLRGHPDNIVKQLLIILSAFLGAHIGYMLIVFLVGGNE